jgi:hypothetical protein
MRVTLSRIERLNTATKDMELEQWRSFESFFLGALSVEVSDEVWDSCLRTTTKFFEHKPETTKEVDHVGPRK